jgi:MFS family permease
MSLPYTASREPLITPRFVGLWTYAFVTFFSAFQLLPAIPFRILELGGSKAEAGWFLSVYTLASAFAAPIMGSIADHIGRRRTLITASILFIAFSLAYGVITHLGMLLVVGMIHGSIWSAILASSSAIMSELVPESRRTEGMAYWGLSSTAAIAIAPAVGLYVYRFGWMTLCIELAVLSVAMAAGGWLLPIPESHEPPRTRPRLAETWDWRVTKVALSLTVVSFGYGGTTSYAAILAVERHITPRSLYYTVFALTIVFVRLFFSRLGDRFGPKAVLYPSLAAIPIALAVLAFAQQRWELILSAALFGLGFGSMYPAFVTFVLGGSDPRRRARTFGSIVWAFDAGMSLGSLVIGSLAQRYGLAFAFMVAAGLSCLAAPIFMATSRAMESVRQS